MLKKNVSSFPFIRRLKLVGQNLSIYALLQQQTINEKSRFLCLVCSQHGKNSILIHSQ